MSIESDLYALLSPTCSGRAFPDVADQSIRLPHVVYSLIFESSHDHLSGDPIIRNARFQFDCWADTKAQAVALGESVRAAIRASTISNSLVSRNPSGYEVEVKLYRESLDFSFWYTVTTAGSSLLTEDGFFLLTEDSFHILLEP